MQTQKSGKKVVDLLANSSEWQRENTTQHSKRKKGSRKEKAEKKLKQLGEGKSLCFAERKKRVFFREVVKVN